MSQREPSTDPEGNREAQPASAEDVEDSAETVEREQAHTRPIGDDAGINPGRQQGSESGPEHDAAEPPEEAR
ncbi:hypothetical protein [Dermatobacter hominis]|uniref:hypothetical protein n=1 Tax=Dermatobacter hominis TaxID=2884263 RepID=UPI001D125889|nr:hypothetical protein [Dermatobacter hominis]UDY35178.1 hypothetical protein LH044_17785 [Dermatobacter hominis]